MPTAISAERPDSEVAKKLIEELQDHLSGIYPIQSQHGYSVDKLIREGVAFFVVRYDGEPAGCGGIKFYDTEYGELKRMYVRPAFRGLGLGRGLVEHLALYAQSHDITCLRLETGIHQTE